MSNWKEIGCNFVNMNHTLSIRVVAPIKDGYDYKVEVYGTNGSGPWFQFCESVEETTAYLNYLTGIPKEDIEI